MLYPEIFDDNRPRNNFAVLLRLNFCRKLNNNLALAQTISLALGAMGATNKPF